MRQTYCDGLPVSYSASSSTSATDPARHCATQSPTGGSTDLDSVESFYTTPPDLHAAEPVSQLLQLPPTSSYPGFINTDFQGYTHPQPPLQAQLRSFAPLPTQGMWPTPPPSTTYEGEDTDGHSFQSSPMSGNSAVHPAAHYPVDSSAASPRSWSSPGAQQVGFPPDIWRSSEQFSPYNMGVGTPSSYEEHYYQQMAPSTYGSGRFTLRNEISMHPAHFGHQDTPPMMPDIPEPSATLSSNGDSPRLKEEEFGSPYQLDEDEEMQDAGHRGQQAGEEGSKVDEPYAQLIYRSFMSRERHAMTLQEIYQWFRDNTEKAKNEASKGWQNSIRHNLSMNAAFVKRDRKAGPGEPAVDPGETKKSTEWVLEDWAVTDGVQSTTRYRKGNPSRRGGPGSHGRSHGNPSARASSGRKGGITASKTKAAASRRSTANRTHRPGFLGSHSDHLHESMYDRSAAYHYVSNGRDAAVTPPETDPTELLFRDPMNAAGLAAGSVGGHGYPYNNHPHHQQLHPAYSQQGHPGIYTIDNLAGVYQPPTHASGRIPGTATTLPSSYNALFAAMEPDEEGRLDRFNSMFWQDPGTGSGGAYQP
ncbi:Uu.00g034970.m01.CDS01 [Anthostomella pinea]|uniref:Uu.00g034970.m01.CDS01 n=1 Tax=Anthostomella pinea TaxID=933095 RepID=A0AAI8V963_9PEZI|nr:Uu.00g034970.m01.CDS01 [Anthostomella pinea]